MSQGFGSEAHVDRGAVKESQAVARSAFSSNEHYIYDLSVSFHNNRRSSRHGFPQPLHPKSWQWTRDLLSGSRHRLLPLFIERYVQSRW